jgi:hypothetical protein
VRSPLLAITDDHFRFIYMNADSSVVLNKLIDQPLNHNARVCRCPECESSTPGSPPLNYFSPFVNVPLAHTVTAILNRNSQLPLAFTPSDHESFIIPWCILSTKQPCLKCHSIITSRKTIKLK